MKLYELVIEDMETDEVFAISLVESPAANATTFWNDVLTTSELPSLNGNAGLSYAAPFL